MNVNEIPRGQLPTIILSSLLDGDKYGYEIIESIEKRTNGEIIIKKPSLYSTLTRLEKQDLVSSYWRDSNIGGRRHYYRLTDFGKKQVLQWQEQLYSSQNKLAQILQANTPASQQSSFIYEKTEDKAKETESAQDIATTETETQKNVKESGNVFLKQENLFNLTNKEEIKQDKKDEKLNTTEESSQQDFIQYDLFSNSAYIAEPETSFDSEGITFSTQLKPNNTTNNLPIEEKTVKLEERYQTKSEENKKEEDVESVKANLLEEKSNLFKQSINELLEKETAAFEERLLNAKKAFNFESEYRKHLKSTKSYAETFDAQKDYSFGFKPAGTFASQIDITNNFQSNAKSFADSEIPSQEAQQSIKKLYNQFEDKLPSNNINASLITNTVPYIGKADINEENDESQSFANSQNNEVVFEERKQNNNIAETQSLKQPNNEIKSITEKVNEPEKNQANSLLITDRIESPPKVKRIIPASFSHLNKNQIPHKRQQIQTDNAESPEISPVLKQISSNQKTLRQEVNTPANEYFSKLGIAVGEYNPNPTYPENIKKKFKITGKKDYVNVKKFNFFASSSTFLLFAIQIFALLLTLNLNSISFSSNIWLIATVGIICLIWVVFNAIVYLKNKDDKLQKKKILLVPLWQKLVMISIFLVLVYSVHLLAGMDTNNITDFATTLALPVFVCFNVLFYHFAQLFVLKK